jgi:hypothetical protein
LRQRRLAPLRRGFSLPILTRAGNHGGGVPAPEPNSDWNARPRSHPNTSRGLLLSAAAPYLLPVMLSLHRTRDRRKIRPIRPTMLAASRAQQLRSHGVPVPAAAFDFRPRPLR